MKYLVTLTSTTFLGGKGAWQVSRDGTYYANKPDAEQLKRLTALKTELGLTEPTPLPPEEAAALRAANELRWAVYFEQGTTVRDPEALAWFALREFRRACKTNGGWVEGAYHAAITNAIQRAEGAEPIYFDVVKSVLDAEKERVKAGREKRTKFKPVKAAVTVPSSAAVARERKAKHDATIDGEARSAYKAAGFKLARPPRSPNIRINVFSGGHWDLHRTHWTVEERQPHLWLFPPNERKSANGSRRHVEISLRRDWLRKVAQPGLANRFGPRTFVLDTNGNKVLIAYQERGSHMVATVWADVMPTGAAVTPDRIFHPTTITKETK